jgi:hypothetical protein
MIVYVIIAIIALLILGLLFFYLKHNKKDKEKFEHDLLNQSDVMPEHDEEEI